MRRVTRRAAGLEPGAWDDGTRRTVAEYFNGLAGEWHTRDTPERRAVVADAVERGLGEPAEVAVELGAGTGTYSDIVATKARTLLAIDIAEDMLRLAPSAPAPRLLADCAVLPLADDSVDLVAVINMFLFPDEVARVLRPGGSLLWVNVSGADTPIHLSDDDVVASLPFPVEGVGSAAGVGTWCALRRVG